MAARLSEAERMHRHNAEMRFALAHGLSLAEARYRLFQDRQRAADRARHERLARLDEEDRARREAERRQRDAERPAPWWNRD